MSNHRFILILILYLRVGVSIASGVSLLAPVCQRSNFPESRLQEMGGICWWEIKMWTLFLEDVMLYMPAANFCA